MTDTNTQDKLLRPNDIAAMFGLSHYAVLELMKHGRLPPHVRVFNGPAWRRSDIDAWITRLKARKEKDHD